MALSFGKRENELQFTPVCSLGATPACVLVTNEGFALPKQANHSHRANARKARA